MNPAVFHGDNRDVLKGFADNSFDSVCTDPPYELTSGKKGGTGEASLNLNSPAGRARISTGGFMGRSWDATGVAFDPALWAEVLRVLKPGGHLVAFGGTRTYHRMACAIEDAGFEIRDSLHWIYGSGMPKGLNISKAIDRMAGAEREVTGTRKKLESYGPNEVYGSGPDHGGVQEITAPATPEAVRWEGWNSSTKPSHEPVILARKPLEGSLVANVLKHGTGGINVAGCRVGVDPITSHGGGINTEGRTFGGGKGIPAIEAGSNPHAGRWPANILFTHSPGCVPTGIRKVRNRSGSISADVPSSPVYADRKRVGWQAHGKRPGGFGDVGAAKGDPVPNGPVYLEEEVVSWNCEQGCPVSELDRQSGGTTSARTYVRSADGMNAGVYGAGMGQLAGQEALNYGDTGGASRFFPQFSWSPEYDFPYLYQAKAARKERPKVKSDGGEVMPGGGGDISHPTLSRETSSPDALADQARDTARGDLPGLVCRNRRYGPGLPGRGLPVRPHRAGG